ncbi:hypothetical protein C2E20_0698 [Micractinium conductrix]|uniref:Uncharacterized protein n=1 Tax=Micractinium conductrix TaxID=554055 RepID=A0A2P6VRV2_9CHLO|nr:hypothetical protein C2E20_0698 [Micractinium conductrix]|eukprot:PSC76819.1 hypothetical protein C2E20_0698 [Micractinium conductrix]
MPGAALATLSSTVARSLLRSAPAAVQIPASHAPQQRHSFVSTRRPPAAAAGKAARVTAAAATAGQAAMAQPFVIVGGGRVGQSLADMGAGADVVVKRGQPVTGPAGPIVVCTRNDDLQAVVDATAPERRQDLVFIQNGMLQPWLDERGLGDATQVLVYFAVAKQGDAPTDGKTDVNPEGLTAAYGRHAAAVAARLHAAGLSCMVLEKPEFTKCMLEKLVWISAFMLAGARHGGCTVGEVEGQYKEEVGTLIDELAAAGAAALGVTLDAGVRERLCAYARSVAHFPTAVKEFPWRNGYFYGVSKAAAAGGLPDPCPTHTAWLQEVGAI